MKQLRFYVLVFTAFIIVGPDGVVRAEEGYFKASGVTIRYISVGKGETIVLLHGFAANAEMWENNPIAKTKVFSELAKDFHVVAMDCRGHGKSDKPHDPKMYGKEMVKDVIRLLDHLKVKKAHIVGYSMGAEIAGNLLVTYPKRLLSVTMGGGTVLFEPSKESVAMTNLTAASLEEGKGIAPVIIAGVPPGIPKPSQEIADAISRAVIGNQDQKALAASIRGSLRTEVTEAQLKANRVPALILYGSRDGGEVVQKRYNRIAQLLNAQVKVVEGGDHVGTYGMPDFLEAVKTFIRNSRK
ncbi:MAG: alpha/beta fold hydrolase [Pyrinomonadaceae bacterium]